MLRCKLLLIVFSIPFLFYTCGKRKNNNDNKSQLHFNVYDWNKNQMIQSEFIEKIRFVPLETKKDNLIGTIHKIVVFNGKFYIMDGKFRKDILVFNNQGKFIKSIGYFGKGAGEYIRLGDFNIDVNNNLLIILDSQVHKLLFYNLANGKCVKEYKLDFWASNFLIEDEKNFLFYSKDQISEKKYSIARLNLSNNKCDWFLEQDEYDTSLSTRFSMFQSEKNYFTSYFKDVVYQITNDGVIPYATFNFGKQKIPGDRLKEAFNEKDKNIGRLMSERDWTFNIENFHESSDFITFNFKLESRPTFVIYSKNSKNFIYGSKFEKPFDRLRPLHFLTINQNEFITAIDASSFKKIKEVLLEEENEFITQYPQSDTILSNQSNPVIISLKFKPF